MENSEYGSKKEIDLQKRLTEARSHAFHQELVWYHSPEVNICNLQLHLSLNSVKNPYHRIFGPSRLNQVWACGMPQKVWQSALCLPHFFLLF